MRIAVGSVFAIALAAGCATARPPAGPTPEQRERAKQEDWFGPQPEDHETLVLNFIHDVMREELPSDAFQMGPIERAMFSEDASGGAFWWGWWVPVRLREPIPGAWLDEEGDRRTKVFYLRENRVEFVVDAFEGWAVTPDGKRVARGDPVPGIVKR